jgi:hypothetical protein
MSAPPKVSLQHLSLHSIAVIHAAVTFVGLVLFVDAWPYWKDAGQLMAAYGTGGLPHPTGFPLIASFGRLASLLPIGSMAFRINLLSAGTAAITSTALFALVAWLLAPAEEERPWGGWILAWGASWAFLAARTVWFHSLAAEVYLPSAALSAGIIAVAMRSLVLGEDPQRDRALRLLALGTGLASGVHVTAFAAGVGALALVALTVRRPAVGGASAPNSPVGGASAPNSPVGGASAPNSPVGGASAPNSPVGGASAPNSAVGGASRPESARDGPPTRWSLAVQLTLLLLAGLLIQWYLPLRSWSGPWTKFADASDLGGWFGYATGRTIRSAFQGEIGAGGSVTTFTENAALYGTHLVAQAGPALLLAVLGLLTLARRAPLAGLLAAAAWGGDLVFTVVINPMGQKDFQTGVLSLFIIFLTAALGAARLVELLPRRRLVQPAAAALIVAGILVVPVSSFPSQHRALGANGLPYRYGLQILRSLPPGSLVLTTLDDASGLLLYHQLLENRRRDSLNLVVQNVAVPGLVSAQAARYGDIFFPEVTAGGAVDVNIAMIQHSLGRGNPVFWQPGQMAFHGVVRGYLEPGYPLGRVRVDTGAPPPEGRWRRVLDDWEAWRAADPTPPDPMGSIVLADSLGLAGALQVEEIQAGMDGRGPPAAGPVATAEALFTESLRLYDEDCRAWSNYAVLKGLQGQVSFAMEAADRAANLCPLHPASRANQVRYRILSGKVSEGLEAAAEITALPNFAEIEPRLRRLADDLGRVGLGEAGDALRRLLD